MRADEAFRITSNLQWSGAIGTRQAVYRQATLPFFWGNPKPKLPIHAKSPGRIHCFAHGQRAGQCSAECGGFDQAACAAGPAPVVAAVGEGSDTCLLEQPAQYLHGQEPDLSPFQFPPEQALAFNEVDLGFHLFFGAAMDETRQSTGERRSCCNTVSAMLRDCRLPVAGCPLPVACCPLPVARCPLPLGPMARAIGHAARQAAAAGCGGGWWSG